jgi:hypothetical protein
MKRIIFLSILTLLFVECDKEKNDEKDEINGIVVDLITVDDPIIFRKSVILFDDSSYNIKTPLDTFLLGYPFNVLYDYEEMKAKAINDSISKDILFVADYMKYKHQTIYTLAYYLEHGNCYILDKGCNCSIRSIIVEHYYTGYPGATTIGRRFYIGKKLFLETVDGIS